VQIESVEKLHDMAIAMAAPDVQINPPSYPANQSLDAPPLLRKRVAAALRSFFISHGVENAS